MFEFLFGTKRLAEGQEALRRENRVLRAKLARLEIALVQRRAEDIVGSRDALIPVPRPGSSAHRLLGQNRALRRRAKAAEDRADRAVEEALVEVYAAADAISDRDPTLAGTVRERADRLITKLRAIIAPRVESSVDLYADCVRTTWADVDHVQVADDLLTRLHALDSQASRGRLSSAPDLAALAGLVVSTLLEGGPVAAADVIRSRAEVTEDLCALGGEALLFALALALGTRWTEDVRTAWALAVDDVTKALGFPGHGGAIFSMEESIAMIGG